MRHVYSYPKNDLYAEKTKSNLPNKVWKFVFPSIDEDITAAKCGLPDVSVVENSLIFCPFQIFF